MENDNLSFSLFSSSEGSASKKRKLQVDADGNEYESEIIQLKKMIEKQRKTIYNQAMTIAQIEDVRKNDKVFYNKLVASEAELQLKCSNLENDIENVNTMYKNELGKLKSKMNIQVNNYERENKEKTMKIKELEGWLQMKVNIEVALGKQIMEHQRDQDILQGRINELEATVEDLNITIEEMNTVIETKEKEAAKFHSLITELEDVDKKILQRNMDLKDISFNKLIDQHENEIAATGIKFEDEIQKYEARIAELADTVNDLHKQITSEQNIVIKYKNELNELKEKVTVSNNNKEKLQSSIQELQQKLSKANESKILPQITIKSLQNEITKLRNENGLRFVEVNEIFNGSMISQDCLTSANNNIILNVSKIATTDGSLRIYPTASKTPVNFKLLEYFTNSNFQFQINGELELNSFLFFTILPRIYSCNLTKLDLHGAVISYAMYKKLIGSHTITHIKNVKVQIGNGKRLGYDAILKELPTILSFEMNESTCLETTELCKNLSQLPSLPSLRAFRIKPVDPLFDLKTFGDFVKKNLESEFYLQYSCLSQALKNMVAETEMRKSLPPKCKLFFEY